MLAASQACSLVKDNLWMFHYCDLFLPGVPWPVLHCGDPHCSQEQPPPTHRQGLFAGWWAGALGLGYECGCPRLGVSVPGSPCWPFLPGVVQSKPPASQALAPPPPLRLVFSCLCTACAGLGSLPLCLSQEPDPFLQEGPPPLAHTWQHREQRRSELRAGV